MREGGKFKNRKRKKKHGGKRGRELAGGGINRISEGEFPQTGNQAHCQIHHTDTPSSSNTTRPPPLTHISLLSAYHQNVCECVCVCVGPLAGLQGDSMLSKHHTQTHKHDYWQCVTAVLANGVFKIQNITVSREGGGA